LVCVLCVFVFVHACGVLARPRECAVVLLGCWGARGQRQMCACTAIWGACAALALCLQTLLLLIQARKRCVGRTKCAVQAGVHRFRRLSCESDAFLFGHVQAGLEQNAVRFRGCRRAVKCASTQGRYGTNMLPHQSCSLWSSVRSGVLFGFGGPAKWN
jgi:hypothetical protein